MRDSLRLLRYVRRYWSQFSAAVVLMFAGGMLEAAVAFLIGLIIGAVLQPGATTETRVDLLHNLPFAHRPIYLESFIPHFHPARVIMAAFVLAVAVKTLVEYAATYLVGVVGYGVITDLRNTLFERLINQSAAFFQRHSTGRLMSATINDIDRIQYAVVNSLADAMQQGFTLIFLLAVVLILNWKLTLAAGVLMPLVIVPSIRLGRRVRRTTRKGQDELADVQHILHETFTGNRIVKAFNMERNEVERFRAAARRLMRYNLRYILQQGISSPMMEMLGAVTVAAFVLYARGAISQGAMTFGAVVTFLYALFRLYEPLRRSAGIYNSFQTAAGASQHVFEFLDADADEIRERPGAKPWGGFRERVAFEGVEFSYRPGEPLLRDLSFEVERGEVVAIVGPSGAGKTTLVNLIPRFFDVTAGCVRVDGQDVRDLTLRSLREQIAYVTQDTILFNDSVAANIAYGAPGASPERIRAAAKAALADEFISAAPEGYETKLGERGLRLSGGQRQRIAIARALLRDSPILILDEATSALDTESELLVQRALANLMRNRTVFVIAHRLSTVRSADRILALDGGGIVASGSHEQLHAAGGLYRRLYDLQFADLDLPEPAAAPSA